MPPEQDANEVLTSLRHERKNGWMRRIVLAAIAVLVVFGLVRAYRRIDATAVWDALSRLPWWTPLVLLVLLVARQVLNAAPLAIFLPGVGLYRCTINDLSASTAAAFAPAPSDMVLRVAMFRSWNLSTESALAATTMNAVTFFIARFSAPLLGFALLPFLKVSPGLRLFDLLSLAVAAALIVGVLLVHRSQEWAASLGRLFGKTVRNHPPTDRSREVGRDHARIPGEHGHRSVATIPARCARQLRRRAHQPADAGHHAASDGRHP